VARGVALVAAGAALRVVVGAAVRVITSRSLGDGDSGRRFPFLGGRSIARGAEEIEIFWYRRIRR